MKGKKFTEEQIIGVHKESDAGVETKELCRRHGITATTFYRWKSKVGGIRCQGDLFEPQTHRAARLHPCTPGRRPFPSKSGMCPRRGACLCHDKGGSARFR
jgi:putative transposase